MARRCELTGKGVMVGNNVSHARQPYPPPVSAQPAQRHADLGRAQPFGQAAHLGATRCARSSIAAGSMRSCSRQSDDDLSLNAQKIKKEIRDALAS